MIQKYNITGKLLEIGCGEGRDACVLLERGFDLLATDISSEAVSFCRREWPRYAENFQILDCINDELDEKFDFVYAIAVVHMLVCQEDRNGFYRFIREHLKETGIALICTMGDGVQERCTDISTAFQVQERVHEQTGKPLWIAATSYRAVSFETFERELAENGLHILKQGITQVDPDYRTMMYALVRKS